MLGTQTIATLIAVYGLFMTPLGWKLAGLVWGYAIVWALLTDRVKLLAYRFLDHAKAKDAEPTVVAKSKLEAGAPGPQAKADTKHESAALGEPDDEQKLRPEHADKTPTDLKPSIAEAANRLSDARGKRQSLADQDWGQTEREVGKQTVDTSHEAQAKAEPEAAPKLETNDELRSPPAVLTKAVEPEGADKDETRSDATPRRIRRVHELYEQLGREDVRAAEEWENNKPKNPEPIAK